MNEMSMGQKVWAWTAVVVSVIVLILAAAGVIGVWVGRGIAIDLNNGVMDGVIKLAGVGEEASNRLSTGIGELRSGVGEVENAVDKVSQNVSDKGVILTLLPPEREQNLVSKADKVAETVKSITSSIGAARDLYASINSIPFVSLPKPKDETVQALESGISDLQNDVDQLASSIKDFREGAAAEVSQISSAAGDVKTRLQKGEDNLSKLGGELDTLQTEAEAFKGKFSTMVTIFTIVVTLMLAWIIYAMVILIRQNWDALHA